jgi:hypothetical protein
MAGMAVYARNEYDGTVFANGIPPLIEALDDVAQENDALYRLLKGIAMGDSPNFKLVVALLAIVVPIMANHRPESGALRNVTGALRFFPTTNIPKPPPRPGATAEEVAQENMADTVMSSMMTAMSTMTPEQQEQMMTAAADIPVDLISTMVAQMPGGMAHPDEVHDIATGAAAQAAQDATEE